MALIKCQECNKEISDKAISCPNCGFPVGASQVNSDNTIIDATAETAKENKPAMRKPLVVGGAVLVVLLIVGIILTNTLFLPSDIRYATNSVQELKSTIIDPESLSLHGDILVICLPIDTFFEEFREGLADVNYFIYFDYGARNGYGGMTREVGMSLNGKYVGTYELGGTVGKSSEYNLAREIYIVYEFGSYQDESTFIDSARIMRRIK